ncbi:MAG: hypothetical protein P8X50_08350 [Maritimibacter sp.]|jgi:hypothetical protein
MIRKALLLAVVVPVALSACTSTVYTGGEPPLIATNEDTWLGDKAGPHEGAGAVAVLPNCTQAWVTDEGWEGYGDLRYDPKTGLPVCTTQIAPGSVVGDIRGSDDMQDWLPR